MPMLRILHAERSWGIFWEDDPYQRQNPDYECGANNISLNAAIENYRKIGVSEARFKYNVRPPYEEEKNQ